MNRYAIHKGKIFGDFEVLGREGKNKVICKCINCGHKKIFAISTVRVGRPAKCAYCNKNYGRTAERVERYPERKVTKDTVKLICWYYAEGESIEEICGWLHRNKDLVMKILTESIKNGKYSEYVLLSGCIDQEKATERMRAFEQQAKEAERTAVSKKKRR